MVCIHAHLLTPKYNQGKKRKKKVGKVMLLTVKLPLVLIQKGHNTKESKTTILTSVTWSLTF